MAPGDCAGQLNMDGLQVTLLGASGEERRPLVWLHASHEAGQEIHDRLHVPCALACVDGVDWNRDFSPWHGALTFQAAPRLIWRNSWHCGKSWSAGWRFR